MVLEFILLCYQGGEEYRDGKIQGDGQKRVGVSNKRKSPLKKEIECLKKNDLLKSGNSL